MKDVTFEKWQLAERDGGWFCGYCGTDFSISFGNGQPRTFARAKDIKQLPCSVEHIEPRCRGGSEDLENKVLACYFCNYAKNDTSLEEFLNWLRTIGAGNRIGPYILRVEKARKEKNNSVITTCIEPKIP